MQRYVVAKKLGDGTYGEVLRAVNKQTGEVVAVKRMKKKYYSWDDCMALREVQSLRKLRHPNVVKLKEVIREHDILHMIFEHMECNLYEYMKDRKKYFPEAQLRNVLYQMIQGLAFMHSNGYFHRDMKPENILINKDVTKIADFGLAREIRSKPPYTEYVSTRWYRAPEILLRAKDYNAPVDNFAVGCIIAELFTLRPLFPGSTESDMVHKMCQVLGTPTEETWRDGMRLAQIRRVKFPTFSKVPVSKIMPHASRDAVSLTEGLLLWDPAKRTSASAALNHDFFQLNKDSLPAPAPAARRSIQDIKDVSPRREAKPVAAPAKPKESSYLPSVKHDHSKPSGPTAQEPNGFGPPPKQVPGPLPEPSSSSASALPAVSARRQALREKLAQGSTGKSPGGGGDVFTLGREQDSFKGLGGKSVLGSELGPLSSRADQLPLASAARRHPQSGLGSQWERKSRERWGADALRDDSVMRSGDNVMRARNLVYPERALGGGKSKDFPVASSSSSARALPVLTAASTMSGADVGMLRRHGKVLGRVGGGAEGRDGIWHRSGGDRKSVV